MEGDRKKRFFLQNIPDSLATGTIGRGRGSRPSAGPGQCPEKIACLKNIFPTLCSDGTQPKTGLNFDCKQRSRKSSRQQ